MKALKLTIILAIGLISCDDHNSDLQPTLNLDFEVVTVPNSPSILNPFQVIDGTFSDVEILTTPARGDMGFITDRSLIKYTPNTTFADGTDEFTVKFTDHHGQDQIANIDVRMRRNDECGTSGIFDFVQVRKGEDFEIDLLDNDTFCGGPGNITSGAVSITDIIVPDGAGVHNIFLNSANFSPEGDDDQVLLSYTAPNDEFTGTIEFVYEVGINGEFRNHDVNPIDEINGGLIPEAFDTYVIALARIQIVD